MFLIGKDAEHIGYRYGNPNERIAPLHIQNMMYLIINLGNSSSHSIIENHKTELSNEVMQKYDNYMKEVGGDSKRLIFSIALQFCEIVQWMKHYIEGHPNKEENLSKCVKMIGIVECDDNGFYHVGEYSLIPPNDCNFKGKKVRIMKSSINTNNKTNNIYPYFANDYQVIE